MKIFLKEIGTILGLRKAGKNCRENIEKAVSSGEAVIIDFEGVESLSSSFADELIAKLYKEYGQEKFITYIKFENINDYMKKIINSTIRDRVKEGV